MLLGLMMVSMRVKKEFMHKILKQGNILVDLK